MKREEVKELLFESADLAYKEFNDRITNCSVAPSIGVRVPQVRSIAGEIIKNNWEEYLAEMESAEPTTIFQEEHMLQGIVAGRAKMDRASRIRHLDRWISGILSWADCDCCISSFKFMKKDPEFWFDYNKRWLESRREFELRYAIVAFMQYFINEDYIDRVLDIFAASYASDELYYVKMAQAWALSVCFVKYRDKTLNVFEKKQMDSWIQNKAIQKCRESYRVSKEDKDLLKTLRSQ